MTLVGFSAAVFAHLLFFLPWSLIKAGNCWRKRWSNSSILKETAWHRIRPSGAMEIPVFSTTSGQKTFRATTGPEVTYEKVVAFDLVNASDVAARV